ncbi:Phosphoribosylamine--glycine ligase [hydrothermal vent metagenome]|uniref:phosphoribosylamine--glycine ligase n=1 Tax=hydrothermal vent metagenome TaxID=652676 RepID=A0A3B1D8U1_9ZZZZ
MRVLIVGGGGREHALAWKIGQSAKVEKIYCAPGNAGTAGIAENVDIPADHVDRLLEFALENKIDLTVVGPEQALVLGIVDKFREHGLRVFGPSAEAATLEGSKVFCKDLMQKYGIPTGDYQVFEAPQDALEYVQTQTRKLVVKADGLAAGKGVIICNDGKEAANAIQAIMQDKAFGEAGDRIVVEEFLAGQEVSLLAFTDGTTVLPLDSAQDHKAAFDGDLGPNTGGMGAYSPAPVFTDALKTEVMQTVMQTTVDAMKKEGRLFQGILYAGLMLTKAGPKVLEFNARFGDPETQPLLMRMQSDIVPLFEACIDGTLDQQEVVWKDQSAVCVVLAAKGYPGKYAKGHVIHGLDKAGKLAQVFHAGTKISAGDVVTSGGRVLGVTALGDDTQTAIATVYRAVEQISWDGGMHFRKDIGKRAG